MAHYNFKLKYLSNLNDVDDSGKYYYKYKGMQFYYKKNNDSDKLVVAFHGSAYKMAGSHSGLTPLPIFRNYNLKYNILCLSDRLLEDFSNQKLQIGWFLSPCNSNYKQIYTEIMDFFVKRHSNTIFYASSAGGFPALYFSSVFSKKCLLLNSQFYIKNYTLFEQFKLRTDMEITDFDYFIPEDVISHSCHPSLAIIYCNLKDEHHYNVHFLPFKEFIEREKLEETFSFIEFTSEKTNVSHHSVIIPDGESLNTILDRLFTR